MALIKHEVDVRLERRRGHTMHLCFRVPGWGLYACGDEVHAWSMQGPHHPLSIDMDKTHDPSFVIHNYGFATPDEIARIVESGVRRARDHDPRVTTSTSSAFMERLMTLLRRSS